MHASAPGSMHESVREILCTCEPHDLSSDLLNSDCVDTRYSTDIV